MWNPFRKPTLMSAKDAGELCRNTVIVRDQKSLAEVTGMIHSAASQGYGGIVLNDSLEAGVSQVLLKLGYKYEVIDSAACTITSISW